MNKDTNNQTLFSEFPPISTQAWEQKIAEDLKGADYEKKLIWNTYEGIKVKPYYRAEDSEGFAYQQALPGQYPFVRGNKDANNVWQIREEIVVKDVSKANQQALKAIARGAMAISFKVKELAYRQELAKLLKGINLEEISVHFFSSHSYSILANLLIEFVGKAGFDPQKVKGSFNFDSIAFYLFHSYYYNSKDDNFNEAATLIKYIKAHLPHFKVLNVNGVHFYNAGGTAVQELAYVLASANEYMVQMTERGLPIDDVCADIQLTFGIGSNYFMEIAKLRAARLLWARMAEQHKPENPDSLKVEIHATSGTWNKSIYDPYVNVLRLTTECMSAAIGGANAMTILPFNNIYTDADEFSARIASNIQIILKEEAYLGQVIDPSAGSYYIETLTDEIAQRAWQQFLQIEEAGGILVEMENGNLKRDIEAVAAQRNLDIAMRKSPILGTNIFPNLNEDMLKEIRFVPVKDENAYLNMYRGAEAFEEIRLATEKFVHAGGSRPKVFLASYGNLAMRKARATFATNFFGCAGYEMMEEYLSKDMDTTVKLILKSKANILVICSSDEEYADYAPDLAKTIKLANPNMQLVIAGYPKDSLDQLKAAGIDDFIHTRLNVVDALTKFQKLILVNP